MGCSSGCSMPAFGWLLMYLMVGLDFGSYVYPMVTGFALVAPFAAAGFYEISRRLETGEPLSWGAVFGCIFGPGGKAVGIMAIVTTFSYIIWLDIAAALYVMFFSMKPLRFDALLEAIITTPKGMVFFVVGNAIGAVLALMVFSIMVVSLPMVFDREVDFVTAMITSVKAVLANPKPMLLWCVIIGVLLGPVAGVGVRWAAGDPAGAGPRDLASLPPGGGKGKYVMDVRLTVPMFFDRVSDAWPGAMQQPAAMCVIAVAAGPRPTDRQCRPHPPRTCRYGHLASCRTGDRPLRHSWRLLPGHCGMMAGIDKNRRETGTGVARLAWRLQYLGDNAIGISRRHAARHADGARRPADDGGRGTSAHRRRHASC